MSTARTSCPACARTPCFGSSLSFVSIGNSPLDNTIDAPAVRWFKGRVAPHALFSDAASGHIQCLAEFAPFDLPEFVQG